MLNESNVQENIREADAIMALFKIHEEDRAFIARAFVEMCLHQAVEGGAFAEMLQGMGCTVRRTGTEILPEDAAAMERDIDTLRDIYGTYQVPEETQDFICRTMASCFLVQLGSRQGSFYNAALDLGVVPEEYPREQRAPVVMPAAQPATKRRGRCR